MAAKKKKKAVKGGKKRKKGTSKATRRKKRRGGGNLPDWLVAKRARKFNALVKKRGINPDMKEPK